jgi:hypothetical protein
MAFVATGPKSYSGRPIISMDPEKQGQLPASASQYSYQNQNPQTPQFQTSPISQQSSTKGKQQNKVVLGAVGILVAGLVVFLVFGKNASSSSSVSPNTQQSGSSYTPISTDNSQYYSKSDDWPSIARTPFMDSCTNQGKYDQCLCALETLEATYSLEEALALQSTGDTSYMQPIVAACA